MKITSSMLAVLFVTSFLASAGETKSVEGLWRQIDDKTGKPRSLLRVEIINGEASALILKGYQLPGQEQDADERCVDCPGEFKDKPLYKLRIMWGLKGAGSEWDSGKILDPDEKKIYSVKIELSPDGSQLNVRGYIGLSLFGRTQVWRRYDGPIDD
ncbi:MAG: DUF2147 domain-containing protein [Methylomonas sp.]